MSAQIDFRRREAIASYGVLGAPPVLDLQSLAELAAITCGVSTAAINILDDEHQHQVATVGIEPIVCRREDSMCAAVIYGRTLTVVPDARRDPRFTGSPFVTGETARLRFYASSPIITPAGIVIGSLCVFDESVRDLTEEQGRALDLLAHQVVEVLELRRTTKELQRSNEQLERFAGQVSHDLRNPLAALTGFLELAADSLRAADASHAARAIGQAESAAERMNLLIDDVLRFARIGGARPRRTEVMLEEVIRDALDDVSAVVKSAGAEVVVDASVRVTGDPTLLRAMLQNLIANAVKYSRTCDTAPLVEVRATEISGGWRLTVDDNGPGIPPADRDAVFSLLKRGAHDEVEGLGIGLSTCRRIVQAHGGDIGIDDSPLGGARVWVLLPRGGRRRRRQSGASATKTSSTASSRVSGVIA